MNLEDLKQELIKKNPAFEQEYEAYSQGFDDGIEHTKEGLIYILKDGFHAGDISDKRGLERLLEKINNFG